MDLISGSVFYQIVAITVLAAAIGIVGYKIRQPLVVSFIAVGVLVGPAGLGLIREHGSIQLFAQIGISLLLFIVGLKLDLHMIRTVGPVALATGLGQVAFTSGIGFLIAWALGMRVIHSAYIAVALTFSSTIIIVKLLSDKKEIDSLHGRIAVGFLIVQDIVAILAMIGLIAVGGGARGEKLLALEVLFILSKGVGFLALIGVAMRFVLPSLIKWLARYQELLVLFAIAWAVLLAAVGEALGLSKEVGAFLAGVSIASTGYREAIGARLVSVRDFLLLFFFIDLGSRLEMGILGGQAGNAALFSAFVLIGNPLIVMAIMGLMGYRRRTGFLAGLTVAQISEFSLILGALGISLGHIDVNAMGLITLVGIVTISASTYMILYSGTLYEWVSPALSIFEKKNPHREAHDDMLPQQGVLDVVLLGLGNYGGNLARNLLERKKNVLGVDFDPQALDQWRERGLPVVYGDAGDPELLDQLPTDRTRWVVSTIRDREMNLTLLRILGNRKFTGRVAIAARDDEETETLRTAGADVLLRPFRDAAEQAADALTEAKYALPAEVDWLMALKEIRLRPGSVFAGEPISRIPLRAETGVSILAVSRAGRVYLDVDPEFRVYPGDHVVLMGDPEGLKRAQEFLDQRVLPEDAEELDQFAVAQIDVRSDSPLAHRTLAELRFRQDHGLTVVGICRDNDRIPIPKAEQKILPGDRVILLGKRESVETFNQRFPSVQAFQAACPVGES